MSMETIKNSEDVLMMLDSLMREPAPFWNNFYSDRTKKIPFFVNHPDENLVSYIESGIIQSGRMLELGCGAGRNSICFLQVKNAEFCCKKCRGHLPAKIVITEYVPWPA